MKKQEKLVAIKFKPDPAVLKGMALLFRHTSNLDMLGYIAILTAHLIEQFPKHLHERIKQDIRTTVEAQLAMAKEPDAFTEKYVDQMIDGINSERKQ